MSFARTNELFGDLPERMVAQVRTGAIRIDGRREDWLGIAPAVVDPVGDYVVAGMSKGGDVRAMYLCEDDRCLYVRVDCVGRLSRNITYAVNLHGVASDGNRGRYSVSIRPPRRCRPANSVWAYKDNVLELALAKAKLRLARTLYIQVSTKLVKITVDNTGWHEVRVRP